MGNDSWEDSKYNRKLMEYARRQAERKTMVHREGICEYCGNREYIFLVPLDWVFFCRKHALSMPAIDTVSQRGRVYLALNWGGTLSCHICGKREPVMYAVKFEWLCFKCAWYRLGKMSRRMQVDGYRIV